MTYLEFKKHFLKTTSQKDFTNWFDNLFGKFVIDKLIEILKIYNLKDNWAMAHDIFVHSHHIGCSYDQSLKHINKDPENEGLGDGGIDSYWYDKKNKKLTLIQSKLKKVHGSRVNKMQVFYKEKIKGRKDISNNELGCKKMLEKISGEFIQEVEFVAIQPKDPDEQDLPNNCRIFGWKTLLKESVENIGKTLNLVVSEYSSDALSENNMTDNEGTNVIKVSLIKFLESLDDYNKFSQEALFNANVRADVTGTKTSFFDGFKKTLKNEPKKFGIYNNGLTIVCPKIETSAHDQIKLVDPQIINGQQTTRNLLKIYNAAKEDIPETAFIYIKAIETEDDNFVMKLAQFSNTQASIKEGDLISTTSEFKKLNEECIKSGYYLLAKEGKSIRKKVYAKMKLKSIVIKDLLKYLVAKKNETEMPRAKSAIGAIQTEYVRQKLLSKIEIKDIKMAWKKIKCKNDFIAKVKKRIKDEFDKETAKQKNKIWGFAELAIYKMLINNVPEEKMIIKLEHFRDNYKKDSLIQAFKTSYAYEKLGLLHKDK